MKRYVFLVLGLALVLIGSISMMARIEKWRIAPPRSPPGPIALAALCVAAFPAAFKLGGSGWGPLAAVLILAYAEAGFWVGVFIGWKALKPAAAKVD